MDSGPDSAVALEQMIARYNDAWNDHDLDSVIALHAPGMVFENHTAGERAEGDAVRDHIGQIFENWPDLRFESVRLYAREGVVTQEWMAYATHSSGRKLSWAGVDVIPTENGLIKRKDVYSDSSSVQRQLGLID